MYIIIFLFKIIEVFLLLNYSKAWYKGSGKRGYFSTALAGNHAKIAVLQLALFSSDTSFARFGDDEPDWSVFLLGEPAGAKEWLTCYSSSLFKVFSCKSSYFAEWTSLKLVFSSSGMLLVTPFPDRSVAKLS